MEQRKTIRGTHDLIDQRFEKLDVLRKKGNPYPPRFDFTHSAEEIQEAFSDLDKDTWTEEKVSTAGRIRLTRRMGQLAFFDIEHDGETVQLYFRRDDLEDYEDIELYELGDIIGVSGKVMTTRTGEVTVFVEEHEMLTKAVRPLPDKYHGVQDTEMRYRKRYLDLMMNEDVRTDLENRGRILKTVRDILDEKGFTEVETPMLHPLYGGANAKPFVTHYNFLKQDRYLRISPELYLKRLLVGGMTKVYDLNKNFRNESVDTTHNPEYTMLEVYEVYADYEDMMDLTEEIYRKACLAVNDTTTVTYDGVELTFSKDWPRLTMAEAIEKELGIKVLDTDADTLKQKCEEVGAEPDGESWGYYVQALFEDCCEENIVQPTFIIDHPQETTPLCKQTEYDERLVERFEPFCMGMEIGNAYTELNDPEIQRELLYKQEQMRSAGDEEANPLDEDFLEAIEHGMPPAGGLGVGIDRMIMLLLNKQSIKDVIAFPAMKTNE